MQKVIALAKSPVTYVILAVGIVVGLAFPSVFSFLRPVAKSLPKSEA